MRILIDGEHPDSTSGYGKHTRALIQEFKNDGHLVAVAGGKEVLCNWDGTPVFGINIKEYARSWHPDIVLTIVDCQYLMDNSPFVGAPVCMLAMIDTWPVAGWEFIIFSRANALACPSRWGVAELNKAGLEATHVPLGIYSDVYYYDSVRRAKTRETLGVTDTDFLIGVVGRNYKAPEYKGLGFALEAVQLLKDNHSNARAYFHTNPEPETPTNMALFDICEILELDIPNDVQFPTTAEITEDDMRALYSAFDVLLQPSRYEGFGLPVLEAQACGTPVVVNACSSLTELVYSGVAAKPLGSEFCLQGRKSIPSVPNLVAGLEQIYEHRQTEEDRLKLHKQIAEEFSWGKIYREKWKPLLESLAI